MARSQQNSPRPWARLFTRSVTSLGLVLLLWGCGTSTPAELTQGPVTDQITTGQTSTDQTTTGEIDPNNIFVNIGSFDPTASGRGFPSSAFSGNLPAVVGGRILSAVTQEQGVPLEQLQIMTGRDRQWRDSCLGISAPDELCAQVITPGWKAVVSDGEQYWVYHSDAEAETVRFNAIASETDLAIAGGPKLILGLLEGSVLSAYGVMTDGYDSIEIRAALVTGEVLVLGVDGKAKRSYSVTDSELQAFDQLRSQASLTSFDGLRYGDGSVFAGSSEAELLDPLSELWVPGVMLIDPQAVVLYHLNSAGDLPEGLRDWDAAWQRLICLDPRANCAEPGPSDHGGER